MMDQAGRDELQQRIEAARETLRHATEERELVEDRLDQAREDLEYATEKERGAIDDLDELQDQWGLGLEFGGEQQGTAGL